jgi:hypothetical protein
MKSIVIAALFAVPTSLLATGCPLAPGCGGFTGQSDMVYSRGNDMLVVCSNGGYQATIGALTQEGRDLGASFTDGASGAIISSSVTDGQTGNITAFQNSWTGVSLDETALDHVDAICQDLETRAWWNMTQLPKDMTFSRVVNGFATTDECIASQEAGDYPTSWSCQDQLDLCVDGTSFVTLADGTVTGSYMFRDGALVISQFSSDAQLFADGSLQLPAETEWSTKSVSPLAISHCSK